MSDDRERDFETFRAWMSQLNHEDYLMLARVSLGFFSLPIFLIGYILAKHFNLSIVPQVIVWANVLTSVIIYISILAAFRVYLETRLRIRPLLLKHRDFPMRRLPNVRPGLGLYAPVAIGLIVVVFWSSMLYVEAGDDTNHQHAAEIITGLLAVAGVVFAIGVGTVLSSEDGPKTASGPGGGAAREAANPGADGTDNPAQRRPRRR
jgi:hypothetical protein